MSPNENFGFLSIQRFPKGSSQSLSYEETSLMTQHTDFMEVINEYKTVSEIIKQSLKFKGQFQHASSKRTDRTLKCVGEHCFKKKRQRE